MLSPYKLYKHDMANQHVARTWGPKGKPYKGCKGSICYRHKNVDWTIHRLTPAMHERAPKGSKRRRAIEVAMEHPKAGSPLAKKFPGLEGMSKSDTKHTGSFLKKTSPRWGEGKVPSRMEGRKVVPIPKHNMEINKSTYAVTAVGAGAAMYGGYRLHKHFEQRKQQDRLNGVHNPYYDRHTKSGKIVRVRKGR